MQDARSPGGRDALNVGRDAAETWSRSPSRRRGWLWAVVRTLGVEVPYPLVAVVAFTPYAALSVAAAGGRRAAAAAAGWSRASRRRRLALALAMVPRAVAGPESRGARAAAGGDGARTCTSGGRTRGPSLRIAREHDVDVLSVQELRPELMRRLTAPGAREHGWTAGARGVPGAGGRPRAGASGLGRAVADARCRAVETAPNAHGPAPSRRSCSRPGRAAGPDEGRPPGAAGHAPSAPGWQEALAALPGADARGRRARSWPATSTPRSTMPSCATARPRLRRRRRRRRRGLRLDVARAPPPRARAAADDRPRARRPARARREASPWCGSRAPTTGR